MTRGPIIGPLVLFMLPLMGSSVFQMLYNTVDFLYVGNFLDKTAAAAVGASATLISCTVGLFTGISVGTSVIAAQAIGAGKQDRADKALHSSVLFGIIGGIVITALGILFAPGILSLLNTPEHVIPQAVIYIRIYIISVPFLVFYNMLSGGMRAYGDSSTPFRVLVFCGVINVILDALFIIVIPMGVAGVALGTAISQSLSAALMAYLASREGNPLRLSLKKLKITPPILGDVLRIGLPTGIQTILITFSNIMVQYYINDFGETAVAAFATYYKAELLIYMPIVSFGQAATTFAGQNTGAGQYRRIRKGIILTSLVGAATVAVIAVLILMFPETVFGWFMKDKEVVENALKIATVTFPLYWIYPILEAAGGAVRGMGYSILSMFVIIFSLCGTRIALLAFISHTWHTIPALASVYPITWGIAMILFLISFFVIVQRKIAEPR